MDKSQLKEHFKDFIRGVECLQEHFNNHNKKTLKKFSFEYAFDVQYQTNEPLFCLYWDYNGGTVNKQLRDKGQLVEFRRYINALHDLAYAM